MDNYLRVWLHFENRSTQSEFIRLMSPKTRPCFLDDVASEHHELFKIIELIDFPELIEVQGEIGFCKWNETRFSRNGLVEFLSSKWVDFNLVFEIDGSAESSDEPEDDLQGTFFSLVNGQFVDVTAMFQIMVHQEQLFSTP
jgi:hypothetical protein